MKHYLIEPEKSVIDILEDALAEARRGEIKGIGLFIVQANDGVTTDYASGCADRHLMVTGASYLHHRVITRALEE